MPWSLLKVSLLTALTGCAPMTIEADRPNGDDEPPQAPLSFVTEPMPRPPLDDGPLCEDPDQLASKALRGHLSSDDAQASVGGVQPIGFVGQASSILGPGDVDGDGNADLLLGTAFHSLDLPAYVGAAYLLSGPICDDQHVGKATSTWTGKYLGGFLGQTLGAADISGDGQLELLVAAPGVPQSAAGRIYALDPAVGGVAEDSALFWIEGPEPLSQIGNLDLATGDVNGDGVADLLIGADIREIGGEDAVGSAFLIHGPVSETRSLATHPADASFSGEDRFTRMGGHLAMLGDADGDGLGDLAVSAFNAGPERTGGVALYLGPHAGDKVFSDGDGVVLGEVFDDYFGTALDGDADTNGDGVADMLVSADQAHITAGLPPGPGRTYLFLTPPLGEVAATDADAILDGENDGHSAAQANFLGDLDQDGFDDVGIGAFLAGKAYILYGPILGATSLADADVIIESDDLYFGSEIVNVGDLNGDGWDEVAVGAYGADPYGLFTGAVYLFYTGPDS